MSFEGAIALAKGFQKVRRRSWPEGRYIYRHAEESLTKVRKDGKPWKTYSILMIMPEQPRPQAWAAQSEDMLANDWAVFNPNAQVRTKPQFKEEAYQLPAHAPMDQSTLM